MKKVSLLMFALMFLCLGNIKAQDDVAVLISDDFESYTAGQKIAGDGESWWTTWSNKPGTAEDGVVVELEGNKCAHLTYGIDQVLLLGDEQSGVYDLEFDILVPEGKTGYFNILHDFKGANSNWAMQAYLHITSDGGNTDHENPGHGTVHAGGNSVADVECVYGDWMHFRLHVDTDADTAQYFYTAPGKEEVLVHGWKWSLDSFGQQSNRKLAAMNFFPPMEDSEFYLDNFSFTRIGGETAPDMTFAQESLNVEMPKDDISSVEINIENTGSSIAEYEVWIDYGMGENSTKREVITYTQEGSEANADLIRWNDTLSSINFEMAALYPATAYGASVMGTKITGVGFFFMKYVLQATGEELPTFEPGSDVIFRIYGQGSNGTPGKVLAEKTIKPEQVSWDGYTFVEFDEPVELTGFDVYAAVEVTGAPQTTLMNLDANENAAFGYSDLIRYGGGGDIFSSINEGMGTTSGSWYIYMVCQGEPVAGGAWAELDKTKGIMPVGSTETLTVDVTTFGLKEGETYEANVHFVTNVPEKETIDIPLSLLVLSGDNVEEILSNTYNIYPNPTSASVTVEGDNIDYIAIYNSVGQLVKVVKTQDNIVDMSACENGVYYFNIVDNAGQNSIQRVVVAK